MRKPADFERHPYHIEPPLMRAVCKHVTDGDTYDLFLDNFTFEYSYKTFRLHALDTAEIFRPRNKAELEHGLAAKRRVEQLILDKPVLIRTFKDDVTFDRFVADVMYYSVESNTWWDLAILLRREGFEKRESYA
jgi:endonuclease YncB( thermonuclease family)